MEAINILDKDLSKAIALAGLFTLLFGFFGIGYAGGGDYSFHFEKALNGCENLRTETCEIYAPLFHWIASPFTFNPNAFFLFTVFLIGFVTPMLLYFIARNWLVVWLYFATTSYFWFFIDGIFAQATVTILFLLILVLKDWRLQSLVILLSIFAHGHGFFLTTSAFLAVHFWNIFKDDVKNFDFKKKFGKIMLGCSGVFGNQRPEILEQHINGLVSTGSAFKVGHLLIIFTKIFPLPYFLIAVYHLIKSKEDWHFLILVVVSLGAGFIVSHRIFYIMPLVLLPSLSWFATKLEGRKRTLFLVSTLAVFIFQFYSWFNFKQVCAV